MNKNNLELLWWQISLAHAVWHKAMSQANIRIARKAHNIEMRLVDAWNAEQDRIHGITRFTR